MPPEHGPQSNLGYGLLFPLSKGEQCTFPSVSACTHWNEYTFRNLFKQSCHWDINWEKLNMGLSNRMIVRPLFSWETARTKGERCHFLNLCWLFRQKKTRKDKITCIKSRREILETHYHLILLEQLILILDILKRTNAIYENKTLEH